jgi:two-component system sensor histidine kinase CiaH
MNSMFRSATFKLTMWYLALVIAISLIFSVVLYHVATDELARSLHREMQTIYNQFPVFDNSPLLRSSPDYDEGAHRILLRLIGFNLIVLAGAGVASYWLARRTLEPIEEAHEQQKRFTADVSHELRTPLTAIRMESEVALMNKQASQAELRQTLNSNLEEVTKLEALINNLLRLSRLEADELQQSFKTLQIKTLAQKASAQVQPLAAERHITLNNEVLAGKITGDEDSLVQLLVILLDNAVKYSPHDSVVSMSVSSKSDQISLKISDQGIGIEPAQLEHVFDRFYRADNSRVKANSAEGFGLGLSIAKMIADLHHGTIELTSRVGQGTTASISLPKAN